MPNNLPDAPQPKYSSSQDNFRPPASPLKNPPSGIGKTGLALDVGDALTRALDTISTRRMLDQGNHEMFLPKFIANNPTRLGLMEGGVSALMALGQHELAKHGHPKLGKALVAGDIADDLPWAIHNLYIPNNRTAPVPVTTNPKPGPLPPPFNLHQIFDK